MATKKFRIDRDNPPRLSEQAKAYHADTSDEQIDYGDIPDHGDTDWSTLRVEQPAAKPTVAMRLPADVVAFFKEGDPKGYTGRMAAVLTAYVSAHRPK